MTGASARHQPFAFIFYLAGRQNEKLMAMARMGQKQSNTVWMQWIQNQTQNRQKFQMHHPIAFYTLCTQTLSV
jgi:hypothetical protein